MKIEDILDHPFFEPDYPELLPVSTLTCPLSISRENNFTNRLRQARNTVQTHYSVCEPRQLENDLKAHNLW